MRAKINFTALGVILTVLLNTSVAQTMDKVVVPLTHPANGNMVYLPERQQLLVSGFSQFSRWLTQIDTASFKTTMLPIPDDAQFFSKAVLAGDDKPQLIFLGIGGVSRLNRDNTVAERIISSTSLYRVLDPNRLREANFVIELGSGLSDFIIADFQHTHLYRQQADGSFKHYPLQIPAFVQSWRANPDYSPRKPYPADANQDGKTDILFVWQGRFQAFLQQPDGSFATEPVVMNWPVGLSTEQEADQRNDAGRSYSGQNIDTLRDIADIDGDGIADLVINREQLADALERNNSFRIHFGTATEQGLSFSAEPDTRITTDTSPIDVVIDDFNSDGRKDFYIPSTHFGVGTLVRVLLRGSANLDIDFYLLNEQRQYSAKADFRQQATIEVSIGNFRYDMPLFQVANLSGDGFKSLLVGDGREQLRVYPHDDTRLFSRRSEKLKLDLPRDASKVRVMDLTGNGKDDLVLPFDTQDYETLRNQVHFLINR